MPGRQGQRPEYQEAASACRSPRAGGREGAFSAQGTRVLKQPRLCLSLRTPSRSEGLLRAGRAREARGEEEEEGEGDRETEKVKS